MEKVNEHNYEAYFLDYLEGNLSAEEMQDLFLFLENNPELKQMLEVDFSETNLNPSAVIFENKRCLKVEDESVLTLNTADYWMLEAVEGNLEFSKRLELIDFIKKHNLEKTYDAFLKSKLVADTSIVFADKKKLKVATGIVIPIYVRVASVAAAVIFLIGISVNQFSDNSTSAMNDNSSFNFSKTAGFDLIQVYDNLQENTNLADVVQSEKNRSENIFPNNEKKINTPFQQIQNTFVINIDREIGDTSTKMNVAPLDDNIVVQLPVHDTLNEMIPNHNKAIAIITPFNSEQKAGIISEEPYKIVTTAASNITNREISFSRDRNLATNEYVAYGFKVGNFEFERKK